MSIGRYHAAGELHHYLNGSGTGLDLRLLRVCRRVFMEAALLPYWLNSFTFEDKEVRKAFERVVRPGKVLAQRKAVGKYEIVGKKSG